MAQYEVQSLTVVEGEPFSLPEGARVVASAPVHWSMDGKSRQRIVYIIDVKQVPSKT